MIRSQEAEPYDPWADDAPRLTGPDLLAAMGFFQRPLDPPRFQAASDATTHPNSVHLSHLMARRRPDRRTLARLLKDLPALESRCLECLPEPRTEEQLPPLPPFGWSQAPSRVLAGLIGARAGLAGHGFADDRVIIGGTRPRRYQFPSGKRVAYLLLDHEYSANVGIGDLGYGVERGAARPERNPIYVRRASWWFFGALARHLAPGSLLQGQLERLHEVFPALVIAHEICELAYRREFDDGQPPGHPQDVEVETENRVAYFLEEHGVPVEYQLALHTIRASQTGPPCVSRQWLEQWGARERRIAPPDAFSRLMLVSLR